ncbi:MAG: DUF2256 domain-containing protein [Candidatus Puniceispirillaceae bacterium]|jgi:hypothetical protein
MAHKKSTQKMVRKGDLQEKICLSCQRPFTWRKKWARDWDQVKYCSVRCRRQKTD